MGSCNSGGKGVATTSVQPVTVQNIANAPAAEVQQDVNELRKVRVDKLQTLQSEGNDPFVITKYDWTHHSAVIKESFDELEGKTVRVAGRMMSKRIMGKASFCNVQDLKGNIQSYVARDSIGEESYADFKKYSCFF